MDTLGVDSVYSSGSKCLGRSERTRSGLTVFTVVDNS